MPNYVFTRFTVVGSDAPAMIETICSWNDTWEDKGQVGQTSIKKINDQQFIVSCTSRNNPPFEPLRTMTETFPLVTIDGYAMDQSVGNFAVRFQYLMATQGIGWQQPRDLTSMATELFALFEQQQAFEKLAEQGGAT
jgi:hypothetical protein